MLINGCYMQVRFASGDSLPGIPDLPPKKEVFVKLIDFPDQPAVGFVADTKIEVKDINDIATVVEDKLKHFEKIGVYVEMDQFKGISFEALIEDIKKFFPKLSHFKKKAVVCPDSFLVSFGEKLSSLFPGVEVRHFQPGEENEAKKWVIS